jgi:hypothetical protein
MAIPHQLAAPFTFATMQLQNYAAGQWVAGSGKQAELLDASTGELIATTSSGGLDFAAMLHYARTVGGPPLRKMTFPERGRMLKALALYLMERKDKYYQISYKTGATKADSWVDIEGGIGNLFANASLRRTLGNMPFYVDGEAIKTSKQGTFIGHHIMVPKEGVAVHINAFNFPIWGMLEKIAVNWMAGVPAVVKPATVTSYLTEAMVKDIVASGIVPEGAIQLICGSAGDLLDHVMHQDVVTFTGSASTGRMLKRTPHHRRERALQHGGRQPQRHRARPRRRARHRGIRPLHQGSGQGDDAEVRPALHRRAPHPGAAERAGGCADRHRQAPGQHRDRRPRAPKVFAWAPWPDSRATRRGEARAGRAAQRLADRVRQPRQRQRHRGRCREGRLHEPHPAAQPRSLEEPAEPQRGGLRSGEHADALHRHRRCRGPHQAGQGQPLRQHRHLR